MVRFDSQFHDIKRFLHFGIVDRKILQTGAVLQERVFTEFDRIMVIFVIKSLEERFRYFFDVRAPNNLKKKNLPKR